ncbi:MAG TPA: ABC transporter permease [Steroidobacteraceae bacterium]|nr:ABC transporter permease [Steroidobacteraceae bacterium]
MASSLALDGDGDAWRLVIGGDWSARALASVHSQLDTLPGSLSGTVTCDWSAAESPGIGPAWALLARLAAVGADRLTVRHVAAPRHIAFLGELRAARGLLPVPPADDAATEERPLEDIGRWAVAQGGEVRTFAGFVGHIVAVVGRGARKPRALRIASLSRHVYETGVTAIPIVSLIAFLISVIIAYLGAQQLRMFGADIFVVDLIAISVLREMGVLLTAIIVAGRSGSAFAAEIGVMQLNEEIDALRAMGMDPIELLVVPRVLALLVALPLLTVIADAMGLAGGGLLAHFQLHIPWAQFAGRLHAAIAPTTFWAGLIKAPVFAVLIALVGCYRGMRVRESARELGRLTTLAVVQSIFLVIFADALFAILYVRLNF